MLRVMLTVPCVLLGASILVSAGCGRGGPPQYGAGRNEDQKAVAGLVDSLADAAGRSTAMRMIFSPDALPKSEAESKKYGNYSYSVQDPIEISGDTATVTVKVFEQDGTEHSFEWSAKKSTVNNEEKWQLTKAPLP